MSRTLDPCILLRDGFHTLEGDIQKEVFLSFRQLVYRDIYFLLHDHALTEDVIQEAFLKAVAKAPKTRENSNMRAWLRQVTRNTAYDMLRKNKRFRQVEALSAYTAQEETDGAYVSPEDVEEIVERMLRDQTLHQAIGELKLEYRVVLLLYYIAGLSYAEIVEETGLSEQVLTQRLARARKKLALLFSEKWGDRHA
ncbi:RNA polymerase sigma factor [Gorillibacterium sp. sgz5001074]|uniref:RNA polymerase sigma factor n=1 Tax=Gorillibacterium sp. sgz5001074 TaxID=3446695 RepID=UPI003F67AA89